MDTEKQITKLIKELSKPGQEGLAASTALADMGALAVVQLVEALQEEDDYVRQLAALSLGRIGKPAIRPLIETMKHQNPAVRRSAVEALSKIGSEPAVIGAIFQARKDPDETVRQAAWYALGRMHSNRADRQA